MTDGFDILREREAEDESGEGARDADTGAGQEKHRIIPRVACGSEDGYVPTHIFYQHNETGNDVEGCYDDEGQIRMTFRSWIALKKLELDCYPS